MSEHPVLYLRMCDEDQMEYDSIKNLLDSRDYALASILMQAAFHGDSNREVEVGLGTIYLTQAYHLNRSMKDRLKIATV